MNVAFLGLGTMGRHMARNILEAGHHLTVYNRTLERTAELGALGAVVAESPSTAVRNAEVVCLSLSTPAVVRSVVLGEDGVLQGASSGTILVDFSTVDAATSQELAQACTAHDIRFLDAPVSGGSKGAAAGTLTVMVGGERDACHTAKPVLDAVGEKVTYIGPSGAGSSVKLINQMLVGVNLAAVLEAFVAARLAGIDPEVLFDVLRTSAGSSAMLTRSIPDYLMKDQYQPGFSVNLLAKDLDLVIQMGNELNTSLFTPAVALQLFRNAIAAGHGDKDMTAAILPMLSLHSDDTRGGR